MRLFFVLVYSAWRHNIVEVTCDSHQPLYMSVSVCVCVCILHNHSLCVHAGCLVPFRLC